MKKIYTSLMVLATLAMAFTSCNKEIDVQKDEQVAGKMKTITVKTDIETRTTLDDNHQNIVWTEKDVIKIFNNADTTSFRAPYVNGGDLEVQVPATTTQIYAHYPYWKGNNKGPNSVSINISNSQKQTNPGELNGYNYPMVAKGTVTADNKALISLYPVASALALNIYHTGLEGEESVKSVTVTPTENTGFIGSQTTDITGESIQYTTAASSDPITVTLTNALLLGNSKPDDSQTFDGQIYVCLAKQSYTNVKFEIETTKGVYTITSNATPFDCVNNDFVPVNINLAKAKYQAPTPYHTFEWNLVTNANQIAAGVEVVIAAKDADMVMSQEQKTNNRGQVAISKNGNKLGWEDGAAVQVFKVVSGTATDSFGFECVNGTEKGKYIYAAASDANQLKSQVNLDANASWNVSVASSGVASLTAQGNYTHNILRYNSSSSLFACYASASQGDIALYVKGDLIKEAVAAPSNVEAVVVDDAIMVTWEDVPSGVAKYVVTCTDQTAIEVNPGVEEAIFEDLPNGRYTVTVQAIAADQNTNDDSEVITVSGLLIGGVTKGSPWTYTFSNTDFATANTVYYGTDNDLQLSFKSTLNKSGFDSSTGRGVSFGAAKGEFDITISGYEDGIESIHLVVSANAPDNTISATVKDVAIDSQITLEQENNQVIELNSEDLLQGGDIVLHINDKVKSVWLKSISINPEGATIVPVQLVMSEITCTDSGQYQNSLTFSWNAVENAAGYQVSVDGGSTYGDTQTATSYTWTGLSAGTTYTLYVKAIGNDTAYLTSNAKSQSGITKSNSTSSDSWTRVTSVQTLLNGGTFIIGYEDTANSGVIVPMANSGSATLSAAGYLYSGATATQGGSGTIDMSSVSATSSFEVTIEASTKVSGAINIKLGNSYLGNTNTKNNCKLFSEESATTAFTPTIGSNDAFTLKIVGNDTYQYLKYNTGSPRFAVYSTAPEKIVIYKKN